MIYVCMYVYIYIYVCMYVCIYIYIYTYISVSYPELFWAYQYIYLMCTSVKLKGSHHSWELCQKNFYNLEYLD